MPRKMVRWGLYTILSLVAAALTIGCQARPLQPVSPIPVSQHAKPLIIDTDMAADDWLAILYLLSHPQVDVQAITVTGTGEAHCLPGTRNALDLVALAGRPEIPVSCGPSMPLAGNHTFPDEWRQRVDNLLGLELPANSRSAGAETAPETIRRFALEADKPLHFLALGPLTNLAQALQSDPALATKLDMVTIMGGAVRVPGNVGPSSSIENDFAEWNLYVDPLAAAIVFQSGVPLTLVPLDATNQVPLTMDFYRRLKADRQNDMARFVYQVLEKKEDDLRAGWYYFWDPLAAALITNPGLAEYEAIKLKVIEEEGPQSGRTLESPDGRVIQVATSVDGVQFETNFLQTLNGRIEPHP